MRIWRAGEGEEKKLEDKCFKSDHKGEITVQARIIEKYVSKNRMNNLLKIARETNKEKIKVKGIKSCGLAAAELRFSNVLEANKCLNLERRSKEENQINYDIPGGGKRV